METNILQLPFDFLHDPAVSTLPIYETNHSHTYNFVKKDRLRQSSQFLQGQDFDFHYDPYWISNAELLQLISELDEQRGGSLKEVIEEIRLLSPRDQHNLLFDPFPENLPQLMNAPRIIRDVKNFINTASNQTINYWVKSLLQQPITNSKQLSLLTYNVFGLPTLLGGRNFRRFKHIGKSLSSSALDIISLQELWTCHSTTLLAESNYPWIVAADKTHGIFGSCGLAILSRYPVIRKIFYPFKTKIGVERFVTKGALLAQIEVPYIGLVNVFNVHLISSHHYLSDSKAEPFRLRQIDELFKWVDQHQNEAELTFVTGDFNANEHTLGHEFLEDRFGTDLYRQRLSYSLLDDPKHIESRRRIIGNTFDPRHNSSAKSLNNHSERLDYIFVNKSLKNAAIGASRYFVDERLNGLAFSDHFGVGAKIALCN